MDALSRVHPLTYLGLSLVAFAACLVPMFVGLVSTDWVYVLVGWFAVVAVMGGVAYYVEGKKAREYRKVYLADRRFFTLGGGTASAATLGDFLERCILQFANMDRNPRVCKMPMGFIPKYVIDTSSFGFDCEHNFQTQFKTVTDGMLRALGAGGAQQAIDSREVIITRWKGSILNLETNEYRRFNSIDELELILNSLL